MILHQDITRFSARSPVVTVGIFDGVHVGHQYLLQHLINTAEESGGESVVITFLPHPRLVLNNNASQFRLLTSQKEKIRMIENTGVEHLVILPFTTWLSRLSSCDFMEKILIGQIGVSKLIVGYNHRFGRDRKGDYAEMKKCADRFGFEIQRLDPFQLDEHKISSSEIRKLLMAGKIQAANRMLGRDYGFSGNVVGGSRLGSSIGFPTANITPDDEYKLIPADGVYAVEAEMRRKTFKGMMNIGSRPTVNRDPGNKTLEVNLFDFQNNIYRDQISVRFKGRIRDEKRFDSIDALRIQLAKDRKTAIRLLKET